MRLPCWQTSISCEWTQQQQQRYQVLLDVIFHAPQVTVDDILLPNRIILRRCDRRIDDPRIGLVPCTAVDYHCH